MMSVRNFAVAAVSTLGLSIAMHFEGLKTTAYLDEAGVPTICYGHTKGVKLGDRATSAQCEAYLREDIKVAQAAVARCTHVPLRQNQYDAVTIFTFNVGGQNYCSSTLSRKLNAGDYMGAAAEFPRWDKLRDHKTGQLRPSNGLSRRRYAEQALFLKES